MSDSHDPVKDAFKHLFGKDKKEDETPEQNSSLAGGVTAAAAALGQQATAQNAVPSNPFADPIAPVEQSSAYANPFADSAQTVEQPTDRRSEQPAEQSVASPAEQPAPTTYTNPFADNAVPAPAAEAAPAPVQESAPVAEPVPAPVEAPAPAPVSNPDVESINGHAVGYAFLRYYQQHPEIGLPVDEQHGNVGGYQMFEHAILKWDGSNVQVEQRGGGQPQGGGGGQSQGGGQQRTYTVQSGDNLTAIAQQVYGDAGQWRKIYDANRDKISNPDLIHPGQQFIIP